MHRFITRTIDQPAPGADWSFVPSSSDRARLLSIVAALATDTATNERIVTIIVTDETGNAISVDITQGGLTNSTEMGYSLRPGNMYYGEADNAATQTSSIPGFWLPPGATVAASTSGLHAPSAGTQAEIQSADETSLLPVTIVTGVNDAFTWTGAGGLGPADQFVIAPGVYATVAATAAAISAAIGPGAVVFDTQATCADGGGGTYLFTAVADLGAAGNSDTVSSGTSNDAFASIFTEGSPLTLASGTGPFAGDRWEYVVATFVVADERSALIAEMNLAGFYHLSD